MQRRRAPLTNALMVSDLHLNVNPRDAYRWKIWDVLLTMCNKYSLTTLFILGDLTEEKDFHSAHLVNGIVDNLERISKQRIDIAILSGNHDGIDPKEPFFRFLRTVPGVSYSHTPDIVVVGGCTVYMLPHCNSLQHIVDNPTSEACDIVMAHITVEGALPNIGSRPLPGIHTADIANVFGTLPIYSGDVHKPQKIGTVEYIGAPYHINFGDEFTPQLVWFDAHGRPTVTRDSDFSYQFPRRFKFTIKENRDIADMTDRLGISDQFKVSVIMRQDQMPEWQEWQEMIKDAAKRTNAELVGTDFTVMAGPSDDGSKDKRPVDGDPASVPWRAREAFERYCDERRLARSTERVGRQLFDSAE
jgi:hypothetical protein